MSNQKKERRKAVAKVTSLQTKTKTSPAHPGGRVRGTVWTAGEELRRRALAGDGEGGGFRGRRAGGLTMVPLPQSLFRWPSSCLGQGP